MLRPPGSPGSLRVSSPQFDGAISLNDIMRNRTELEHFKVHNYGQDAYIVLVHHVHIHCTHQMSFHVLLLTRFTEAVLISQIFLNEHLAAQDLMCWMEIEAFRGIPATDRTIRDIKAKQLRVNYFNKKYFFGPSSPATKEQQRQVYMVATHNANTCNLLGRLSWQSCYLDLRRLH